MTQLLDDLRALDALFSDESKWTKGVYARDALGGEVSVVSPVAVCWCLSGGGRLVISRDPERHEALIGALNRALPQGALPQGAWYVDWQDNPCRTFDEVKALIAKAIATEEGRGSP